MFGSSVLTQGCGATLVSDKYVVTAAHCTAGSQAGDLKVVVGDTILNGENGDTSFMINVVNIKQHEDYDSQTTKNDIALLELSHPVNLTAYPNIKPICLPGLHKTYGGQVGVVSGWGTVGSGLSLTAHLHEVTVSIYSDGDCGAMEGYMSEDMICAGLKTGGKDSCQGDSGGPLFTKDQDNNGAATLAGVVSWGFGCGEENQLGVYSEVSFFISWLEENMGDINTCPPPTQSTWSPSATTSGQDIDKPSAHPSISSSTTRTTTTTARTTTTTRRLTRVEGNNSSVGYDMICNL